MYTDKRFTAYDIQACLHDVGRAELFKAAIFSTVREGDVVVDAGSGSGLLGLFAAQAGAKRVYCVESNDDYIPVIRENARRNGFANVVQAIHADATTVQLPSQIDVIISEVISAGFFYEPQLQIVNNLRRFLNPGGRIIPLTIEHTIELISAEETLYGLNFSYDSRYHALDGDRSLTNRQQYLRTDFTTPQSKDISAGVRLRGTEKGTANALRLHYRIEFTPGTWAEEPTSFLMNPQTMFLPATVEIEPDQEYQVHLAYRASRSPLTARIQVSPVGHRAERMPAPTEPAAPQEPRRPSPKSMPTKVPVPAAS